MVGEGWEKALEDSPSWKRRASHSPSILEIGEGCSGERQAKVAKVGRAPSDDSKGKRMAGHAVLCSLSPLNLSKASLLSIDPKPAKAKKPKGKKKVLDD